MLTNDLVVVSLKLQVLLSLIKDAESLVTEHLLQLSNLCLLGVHLLLIAVDAFKQ